MYFITFDSNGAPIGSGFSDDGSLPEGAQECTSAAAESYDKFRSIDGELVERAPEAPAPSDADVRAQRDAMLAQAARRIAPLQYAVELKDATDDEKASLKAWKQYSVALNRIEAQTGFPGDVEWPVAPA